MDNRVCPADGQSLEWHMRYQDTDWRDRPLYFGDLLGCGFISPMDRINADRQHELRVANQI